MTYTEDIIKSAVDKFLRWKLPEDFCPDCGISFERERGGAKFEPTGTNILNAEQAKAMFEHCFRDSTDAVCETKGPDGYVLVKSGALQMVINALRRDAAEGKLVRGDMADELVKCTLNLADRVPVPDQITVNLVRLAGLDKHKARECEQIVMQLFAAAPQPPQQTSEWALTERELELIDGMIAVQLDHAQRCDSIANRTMADKQKGWGMERVALLRKLRELNGGGK